MAIIFSAISILFSLAGTISYSHEVKLALFGFAAVSLGLAIAFFISGLIEKDTVTPKCSEVKVPLRDSKGRYVKGHAPTHLKK